MCDTVVALGSWTKNGSVIFGKNSDREPDEVQNLEVIPEQEYPLCAEVKCTYISIPQVSRTNRIFLCRPFWMFGAEMGANEHGVVIGNEAIFTKDKPEKIGLTGMDLLRLALERSESAKEALDVIINLLEKYGQGGKCGYRFNLYYMNSYIIADRSEVYVLETNKRNWIWKKVKDFWSISNIPSIEDDFDDCAPGLIEDAVKRGFCKRKSDFNFKKSYSGRFMTWAAGGAPRECQTRNYLQRFKKELDIYSLFSLLRSHGGIQEYRPDKVSEPMVCFHSANKLFRRTQTVCSITAELSDKGCRYFTTGSSNPCLSPYFPIFTEGTILPKEYLPGGEFFDLNSFWWRSERFHRRAFLKTENLRVDLRLEIYNLEDELKKINRNCIQSEIDNYFKKVLLLIEKYEEKLNNYPDKNVNFFYRKYWNGYNKKNRV
ncbi:MAG: C69 family dipeptidase [bacterium]|nr:C69 family dipeptidase [bacterium]